jgi:elongation factor P
MGQKLPVSQIKKKNVLLHEGNLYIVLECAIRTPPNNASYAQLEIRNIKNGSMVPLRTNIGATFEVCDNSLKSLELLYQSDGNYYFQDPKTFEEYPIPGVQLKDAEGFLVENASYQVLFVDEKPVSVELPAVLEMKVISAPPAVKGDSSGSVQKPVTLETGLIINVPLFIKEGEVVKVATENKQYQGRA